MPIIDIEEGAEYVGPTKLVGLSDDLNNGEQITIQDKIGMVGTRPFVLGRDYEQGVAVEYEAGWYRARVHVTDATEVPPLDEDNWEGFYGHGIESFGEYLVDRTGGVGFAAAAIAATGVEGGIDFSTAHLDAGDSASGQFNHTSLPNTQIDAGGALFFSVELSSLGDFPSARATVESHRIESHEDGLVLTAPSTDNFGIRFHVNH